MSIISKLDEMKTAAAKRLFYGRCGCSDSGYSSGRSSCGEDPATLEYNSKERFRFARGGCDDTVPPRPSRC